MSVRIIAQRKVGIMNTFDVRPTSCRRVAIANKSGVNAWKLEFWGGGQVGVFRGNCRKIRAARERKLPMSARSRSFYVPVMGKPL